MLQQCSVQSLPQKPFVSLAEALAWIAFGNALTLDELRAQVAGHRPPNTDSPEERLKKFFAGTDDGGPEVPGTGYFHDRQSGLDKLTEAWRQLRDEVRRGSAKVWGRYTATYSRADAALADTKELTGLVLATFSQFDVTTGGIRRQPEGAPDILWQDHPQSFEREFKAFGDDKRAGDGYLSVEVQRDSLLGDKPAVGAARAPSVKAGRPPCDSDILAKAREMKARGLNGRRIAQVMRHEPGFENVATTQVRELTKGLWKPGGRPKLKGA